MKKPTKVQLDTLQKLWDRGGWISNVNLGVGRRTTDVLLAQKLIVSRNTNVPGVRSHSIAPGGKKALDKYRGNK